jgi:hypothetical protein
VPVPVPELALEPVPVPELALEPVPVRVLALVPVLVLALAPGLELARVRHSWSGPHSLPVPELAGLVIVFSLLPP